VGRGKVFVVRIILENTQDEFVTRTDIHQAISSGDIVVSISKGQGCFNHDMFRKMTVRDLSILVECAKLVRGYVDAGIDPYEVKAMFDDR
jgi:hypothetical protein